VFSTVLKKEDTYQQELTEFKDDKRDGKGFYRWQTGDEYNGCWKNGERDGYGELKWKNGDLYKGNWSMN
jgi:hypothetical protein